MVKKITKKFGRVIIPALIGSATIGVGVKSCEHSENEMINTEFKTEFSDADTVFADAEHDAFYAEKKADTKKIKKIEDEIKILEEKKAELIDSLAKQQKKDNEAFLKACKTGKKEDVEKALKAVNVNITDKNGNTGLMLALQNKNFASAYAISQFLLKEEGLNVNKENKSEVNAVDLIRQLMAKNPAWSPIERKIMEKSEQSLSYDEKRLIICSSPEKKALSNKIDFYENKITDLRQKQEKYSAYLLDAKNGNYDFSTESIFVGIQDEDVKKEIVSELKNNYKKRKKGEKVERIEKIMNRF